MSGFYFNGKDIRTIFAPYNSAQPANSDLDHVFSNTTNITRKTYVTANGFNTANNEALDTYNHGGFNGLKIQSDVGYKISDVDIKNTAIGRYSWSDGTFSYPTGVNKVNIFMVGAGGGGGGGNHGNGSNRFGARGGGGGGILELLDVPVTPGASFNMTWGSGGTSAAKSDGNAGGASTFTTGNYLFRANGGNGGAQGSSANNAVPANWNNLGNGGNGQVLNSAGNAASYTFTATSITGNASTTTRSNAGNAGGSAPNSTTNRYPNIKTGGGAGAPGAAQPGSNANGRGGGGGGAGGTDKNADGTASCKAGGSGTDGFIVVVYRHD